MTDIQRERAKQIANQAIAYIRVHPKCLQAETFAQLHDYCDANVIGGQDTYLDECATEIAAQNPEWTEDQVNEAALDAVEPVLWHAEQILNMWLEYEHGAKK